jgi:flagellar protein FliS
MRNANALDQYKSISVQSGVAGANPHRMVAMLFEGALDRISAAKGAIDRKEIAKKGELISKAIGIVDGLRATLNHQSGGDISANLASLYDYIERRLVTANATSDVAILDECHSLLAQVKSGWDQMPMEYQLRG